MITAGTLQLGNGGASGWIVGDVTDNATFAINRSDSYIFGGVISGSGAFQQIGTGTTIFTGHNSYTGGTLVTAGTLQLGNGGASGSIVGDVTDNATFAINRSDSYIFGGVISGSGAFQQIGTGTTIFTGNNSYTGGTLVTAGTLQLGNGGASGSIVGDVTDNATFAIKRSDSYSFGGVISGAGVFQQIGTGTTIFTGNNSYTGGTLITAGTLQLGNGGASGSILGDVIDNATFAIKRSDSYSFGGVISGSGAFQQNGTGATILTANNSYTGTTTVNSGFLDVMGSIASSSGVTVNSGGTLTGSGIVSDTTIASGGIFLPGSGFGTFMSVQGNLAFQSGALYLVQLNSTTSTFADVRGTAQLHGNVAAAFAPGSTVMKQYMIVRASGGVSGTFDGLSIVVPNNFVASLAYDPTHAYINFDLNFGANNNLNVNQTNVANALSNFFNSNGGISAVFASLSPAGLTQASGELATGTQQATFNAMNLFLSLLTDPFVAGRGSNVTAGGTPQPYAEEDSSLAYAAKTSGNARDALARSRPRRLPATICSTTAGACGARRSAAAPTSRAMRRSAPTMPMCAPSALPAAPTIGFRRRRSPVLHSRAAAPISR